MSCYDFELVYKAGRIHSDADALSRLGRDDDEIAIDDDETVLMGMDDMNDFLAVHLNADPDGIDTLRKAQDEDDIILEVKKVVKLRKKVPRNFPESWYINNSNWLVLKNNILYKRAYSESAHAQTLQAIIPHAMREEILKDLHGDSLSGHPSSEKMLIKIKRYATWPNLARDVTQFVKNCKVCDQLREPNPHNLTPRVPLEAKNVWDWVVCDLLMLPVASLGYHYVLVFIDVFSGFVKLYKLKTKNTEGVCRAFENLTCLIGPPRLLTSDNGGEFTSELLTKMCEMKGAKKNTSVAYRPQSQGNVERFNRTLIQALRKRLIQYGHQWTDHLQYVEWAYNTTPRSNSKISPYTLMYGREPPLPTFVDVDQLTVSDRNLQDYFKKAKIRSKEVYDEARRRMIESRAKEVEAYNKKAKHTPLVAGEKVYELIPPSTRDKLQPKWDNLMTVKSRRPGPKSDEGTTYVCQKQDGTTCVRNYEQLKRSHAHEPDPTPPPVQETHVPTPPTLSKPNEHALLDPLPPNPAPSTPLIPKNQKSILLPKAKKTDLCIFALAARPRRPPSPRNQPVAPLPLPALAPLPLPALAPLPLPALLPTLVPTPTLTAPPAPAPQVETPTTSGVITPRRPIAVTGQSSPQSGTPSILRPTFRSIKHICF